MGSLEEETDGSWILGGEGGIYGGLSSTFTMVENGLEISWRGRWCSAVGGSGVRGPCLGGGEGESEDCRWESDEVRLLENAP